ncbi:prenyltransferase [Enterococcus sp.]|uniref:prenyltransferase n=1 Tax=Enterococcus sp. TaxID=35783 RepID=UPI0025C24792|nr:prenyltransferase [Enterococcus sp.]
MDTFYLEDIEEIIAHRYDNGADYWTTEDRKLLKGAPFTTLESPMYLLELGVSPEDAILTETAELIFSTWREDGRFKTSPSGGLYPCHTALALRNLCVLGYAEDQRLLQTFDYLISTQQEDGGWKCNKYSFGRGPETDYSTPMTTLTVLDALRFSPFAKNQAVINPAIEFLLTHWRLKKPISPCHYGIGTLFMQTEYPFRGYNLFYYLYVLSFYPYARQDERFLEALHQFEAKLVDGKVIVERVVPKLGKLNFCKKGQASHLATKRYQEILANLG